MNETNDIKKTLLPHIRLDFNINHPSLDECYLDGYACAKAALDEQENPFQQGTTEARYWSDGWSDSYYGEEPLFELGDEPVEDPVMSPESAINDDEFLEVQKHDAIFRFFEITGAIVVTAIVGYQLIEMVA